MMTRHPHRFYPQALRLAAYFRPYACNSREARARMIVVALLIDGETDDDELACLSDPAWLQDLGIGRSTFTQVLHEFCEDLSRVQPHGRSYVLRDIDLLALFREVNEPALQGKLKRKIRQLLECDGRISFQEAQFWRKLRQSWQQAH